MVNASDIFQKIRQYFLPGLKRRRLWMAVWGVALCGVSTALFKASAFGVSPYQCFVGGLDRLIPIPFGTLYVLISLVLLVNVLIMDKRLVGVSTVLNLLFLGYIIDGTCWLLVRIFGEPSVALRAVYLASGLIITCYSAALYYSADMGVSVYDAIALHVSASKKWPFRLVRIGTDLVCVLVGLTMGEIPGVGTILTAFCMGPLISLFREKVTDPMIEKAASGKSTQKGL